MNEDWNCLGEESKDPYSQVCIEAVENDDVFNKFKKDPRYTAILEHVSIEQGKLYAQDIFVNYVVSCVVELCCYFS